MKINKRKYLSTTINWVVYAAFQLFTIQSQKLRHQLLFIWLIFIYFRYYIGFGEVFHYNFLPSKILKLDKVRIYYFAVNLFLVRRLNILTKIPSL